GVARQVQEIALEPGRVELVRREGRRNPAVRSHRAVAVVTDDRDDDAGGAVDDGTHELDSVSSQLPCDELARRVVAALRDAARARAEGRSPGCDVRRPAA